MTVPDEGAAVEPDPIGDRLNVWEAVRQERLCALDPIGPSARLGSHTLPMALRATTGWMKCPL
jgi:hypothetical protein